MLNQIEEKEKYEQIKTKQSILFIYEAWHKVSEETINALQHIEIEEKLIGIKEAQIRIMCIDFRP
jgi:hypothetical protein